MNIKSKLRLWWHTGEWRTAKDIEELRHIPHNPNLSKSVRVLPGKSHGGGSKKTIKTNKNSKKTKKNHRRKKSQKRISRRS